MEILSVSSVSPTTLATGAGATLRVTGQQFSSRTSVQVGTTLLPTTLVSPTQMTAVLPAAIANVAGSYPVSVVDVEPAQQGGTAAFNSGFTLSITNPAPVVTSAMPLAFLAGQPGLNVTVTGSGFLLGTTATLNGVAHPLRYLDSQHVQVPLTSSDLLYARTLSLVLVNAGPGGGSAAALTLQATNYTKAAQRYIAYGDSITYGYKLSSTASAYPALLAAANHLSLGNQGRVGDQACDTFLSIASQHDGYTAQPGTIFSYLIGTNDTYAQGAGGYEAVFGSCHQAVLSWLGLPASAKLLAGDASLQVAGGCVAGPDSGRYGVSYCPTGGAITVPALLTYGAPVYLWVLLDDNAPADATMRVTIDGMTSGPYPVATTPAISTLNHASSSIGLLRLPVAAGSHRVTWTATAGHAGLLGMGTVPQSHAGLPPVIVGDVPAQSTGFYTPYASPEIQLAYSADVRAGVALLQSDGLDLRFVPDRDAMTGSQPEMADGIHPNELGHQHLATAFQTGFVALNGSGGLVAQVVSGVTALPVQAFVVVAPQVSAPYQLDRDSGHLITVANRSAQVFARVQLPEGERMGSGGGEVSVAPGQVLTLQHERGDGVPVWRAVGQPTGTQQSLTPAGSH